MQTSWDIQSKQGRQICWERETIDILWMEEILHQLEYGLSTYNPITYSIS